MNNFRVNQASNSFFINNVYASDYVTTLPSLVQDGSKPKAKAYINPQIVNYEYIKRSLSNRSLPTTNKIHVNPNFRGNSFNDVQIANTQRPPSVVNINSRHASGAEFQQGSCSTINLVGGENVDNEKTSPMCSNKMESVPAKTINKFVSQYKKLNYVSEKSDSKYNKYTWSKDKQRNKYCINKKSQVSSSDNVLVTRNDSNWHDVKHKPVILPASAYKYTAPKKISKVVNSDAVILACHNKSPSTYFPKTKIITKSKMKLINNASPKTKLNFKPKTSQQTPVKRNSVISKFVYIKNKKSPALKLASLVRNKYKYFKTSKNLKSLKYKIDKRRKGIECPAKRQSLDEVDGIMKLFPRNYYNQRKLAFRNSYILGYYEHNLSSRRIHSWRRDQKPEVSSHRKRNHYQNKTVVKIGGILYKSTTNKLTLANKGDVGINSKKIISRGKGKKNYVVYVRGEKFILDKNGKTLKRQVGPTEKDKSYLNGLKRIYIGGVTYVKKSDGVLIRSNIHQARYLVNQAKHKSIAVLSHLKKRSTLPCMIFHKFGKCNRHNKGLCIYKHDQKNVAICKKFLKGNCDSSNCLLSHEVIQEKMATCHFFLEGFCTRENCPFLHVKLNKNAAICENFLQGFCDLGKNCTKRHLYQCPKFDKFGTCGLGAKCPYPHKTENKSKKLTKNSSQTQRESKDLSEASEYDAKSLHSLVKKKSSLKRKENQNKRELKKVKKTKRKSCQSTPLCDQNNTTIECVPKRIKLDQLPCFIPLKSDQQ